MLLEQFAAAAAGARNFAALDEISRLAWRALAEGAMDDVAQNAIAEAVEARRRVLKGQGNRKALSAPQAATARRRPVSPDKAASLARRRRWAASGALPPQIAAEFTQAEVAALAVVARECRRRGRCDLPIDAIAALAGVSRSVVQRALRHARHLRVASVQERRRRGQKSDTNIVAVLSPEWGAWLRLRGGRTSEKKHHVNQLDKFPWTEAQNVNKTLVDAQQIGQVEPRDARGRPTWNFTPSVFRQ